MLGVLLAAGHDQDHLLHTYSWEQLAQQAACVARYQMSVVEMLAEPMLAALGAKLKRGRVTRPTRRDGRRVRTFRASEISDPVEREQRMLGAFAAMGVPVRTRSSAPAPGASKSSDEPAIG